MSLKAALYDHLTANTGVADLVGTRIYRMTAPTSADRPYITFQRISSGHEHHLTAAAGLTEQTYQIDCWAATSKTMESLSEAVRQALDGFYGAMGDDALDVRSVSLSSETDMWEPPTEGSEEGVWRTSMDFVIWHSESVPTF